MSLSPLVAGELTALPQILSRDLKATSRRRKERGKEESMGQGCEGKRWKGRENHTLRPEINF